MCDDYMSENDDSLVYSYDELDFDVNNLDDNDYKSISLSEKFEEVVAISNNDSRDAKRMKMTRDVGTINGQCTKATHILNTPFKIMTNKPTHSRTPNLCKEKDRFQKGT